MSFSSPLPSVIVDFVVVVFVFFVRLECNLDDDDVDLGGDNECKEDVIDNNVIVSDVMLWLRQTRHVDNPVSNQWRPNKYQ